MPTKDITRREFMKVGISCFVGAAANTGILQATAPNNRALSVSRTSLKELRAIPTTCMQCPAGCGIITYLNGDRLVQILGNPHHPNNRGGICAKGIAGINLVNDPERLLFPLKRVGQRGEGKWMRITWDEAFHTLYKRMSDLRRNGKPEDFVVDKGQKDLLLDRFLQAGGIYHVIDRPQMKNRNRSTAMQSMIKAPCLIADVANSRTILNFGANPYANHDQFITMARSLVQARIEKGARLTTFDVRMSETAAKSDTWHPIKAGTDGLVALAMAKIIIDKDLADKNFIKTKTNVTMAQLKQYLSPYSLEEASKASGISAHDIETIADEFALRKPSVAITGGGVTDHISGIQNARCVSLLNWLAGNLDEKGGLLSPGAFPDLSIAGLTGTAFQPPDDRNLSSIKGLIESGSKIDTYFVWMANPVYSDPECRATEELLKEEKSVPFVAVMDTHMTETAMIADLVLPSATYLEGWGLDYVFSQDGEPVLNLRQPAVSLQSPAKVLRSPHFDVGKLLESVFQPKGESREIGSFCLELAQRMGGDISDELPFRDTRDFVRKTLSSLPEYGGQRDFESITSQGFKSVKGTPNVHSASPRQRTDQSARIAIVLDVDKKSGLTSYPEYLPIPAHQKLHTTEFVLTTFKSNLYCAGTVNSKWAHEIQHENRLWINGDVARKMGIRNGDRVRVKSSAGSLKTRVITTERIHPESVAIAEGLGHTAVGNIAKGKHQRSSDLDTQLLWWEKEGNGVNPMTIVEKESQSSGGCHVYKDTVVTIEKL